MTEVVKVCRICKEEKPLTEYWVRKKNKDGLFTYCRSCASSRGSLAYQKHIEKYRAKRREYRENHPDYTNRKSKEWYESPHGRSKTLLKGVERRSRGLDWDVGIDYEFIRSRIDAGYCEVTGIPFHLVSKDDSKKNPFSPSIDRIDPTKPYTAENSRVVIWQFNMMKAEMSDRDLFTLCEIIVEMMRDKFTS